jgi:hypothetical protein
MTSVVQPLRFGLGRTCSVTGGSCRATVLGDQSRLEIAAAGGAGRRSAKNAAPPHGSIARSASPARPLHSPEGG